jgi:hypothetical protein
MQAPFTLATDGTTLPKEISMSPETLKTYLPSPFHELLDMHEPPTELELDAFLPHLLEKSHSLATGLVLALEALPSTTEPLLPMARVLEEYVRVAEQVFTAWNRRDMHRPRQEEN